MKITLETERLILRPFRMEDADAMFFNWANDPFVTRFLTWPPHGSVEKTRKFMEIWVSQYEKPERLNFAMELKETGELIGGIDVCGYLGGVNGTPVLGCAMAKKHWSKGYAAEALRRLVDLLFERGYKEIRADAMVDNIGSNKLIRKCGGVFVGVEPMERPLKHDIVIINKYIFRK